MNTVLLTVENHIATVTLNRPDALNAVNREMRGEILQTWTRVREDDDIRVCILTGAGRAFCSGFDIKETVARIRAGDSPVNRERRASVQDAFMPYSIPKPMIAAVNGPAAGGGLGLALSCDILIASESALFLAPFAVRSIMNNAIIALLAKKAPYGWSSWMNLSSDRISAQSALQMGLVNEVMPQDLLLDRAQEMAERIAANSLDSLRGIKEKLQQVMEQEMEAALTVDGPWAQRINAASEEAEGFTAFVEKRQPQFR